MRTGKIEANLVKLNEEFNLPSILDLIELKLSEVEKSVLEDDNIEIYRKEYQLLISKLEAAYQNTRLPENPSCQDALNDLLVRLRLALIIK